MSSDLSSGNASLAALRVGRNEESFDVMSLVLLTFVIFGFFEG